MHTADRFQGRDKETIVLSLVRSNETQDRRRSTQRLAAVNVALTRARTKLLILGSKSTLAGNDLLRDLIKLLEQGAGVYNLPVRALEDHLFDEGATQFSTAAPASVAEEKAELAAVEAEEQAERRERLEEDRRWGLDKENRVREEEAGEAAYVGYGEVAGAEAGVEKYC